MVERATVLPGRHPTLPTHRQLDPTASASWGLPRLFAGRPRTSAPTPGDYRAPGDPLTGAGTSASWDAALAAALTTWEAQPITIVRLALATPEPPRDADRCDAESGSSAPPVAEHDPERNLVLAAVRWQEALRPGDHLARLDDAEFAVLLPRCGGRASSAVVTRLLRAVPDGVLSAVGVATWDGDETDAAFQGRAETSLDEQRHRLVPDAYDDPARLAAVSATGLARRHPQAEFDEVASSVAWLLGTPVVVITLFDETWQHFIGAHGVAEHGAPLSGTPARDAICRQTVETGRPVVVSDTRRHPLLQSIPPVTQMGVVACASVPVITDDDLVVGSVCAMVLERHTWSVEDVALLKLTARRVAERLERASVALAA